MSRIGIEFISVFGLPPVEFVELTARLGCSFLGLAPAPIVSNPHNYPQWTLRGNPGLLADTAKALADNNVRVGLGEGFLIRPGAAIAECAADLDIMARLGADCVNITSIEADFARNCAEFGQFCDMAHDRGLPVSVEFLPGFAIGTLATAMELLDAVSNPNSGVLIDAMHFYRTGGTHADIAALDPARIAHAQLCDVPTVSPFESYMDEARYERRAPGKGDLPLDRFVRALPKTCLLGLELPMQGKALAGIGPYERLKPAVDAARVIANQR